MKRLKNRPLFACLIILAAAMMIFSGVQTSRAALTISSDNYFAQLATDEKMHVDLLENETSVCTSKDAGKDGEEPRVGLLQNLLPEGDENIHPGENYKEVLCVQNTGEMDEYIRVVLYKYWQDEDGKKLMALNPDYIVLELNGEEENPEGAEEKSLKEALKENGWLLDEEAGTKERMVLYYAKPLKADEISAPFADTIRIDKKIVNEVLHEETKKDGVELINCTLTYEGKQFSLEAEVDGVQTHNAELAIKSAWGADVMVIDDAGTLELGKTGNVDDPDNAGADDGTQEQEPLP